MVCDILPSQDASTHLRNSYLKEYRSFAPDLMPTLEPRSEVKVTVTVKWNVTIRHFQMHSHTKLPSKMHLHTKFGIPTLMNVKPHSHCAGVATVHPDAGQPVYCDAPGHIS